MNNNNNNNNNFYSEQSTTSFKDYLDLIRNNIIPILIITVTSLVFAIIYALNAVDIYKSTTSLKLSKPQGSILDSPLMPGFSDFGNDRFIANEIEVLKSYTIREKVAKTLLDSFLVVDDPDTFSLLLDNSKFEFDNKKSNLISSVDLIKKLFSITSIDQKRGLDIVEISIESPSPYEASLIANAYAEAYRQLNLEINRNQLTLVKNFLSSQRKEKLDQLSESEELIKSFQEKGGIVALDQQASTLVTEIAKFESQANMTKIEVLSTEKVLVSLKDDLKKKNPQISTYIESGMTQEYLKSLQTEIAKLELNKTLALNESKTSRIGDDQLIKEYDKKIDQLQTKLNKQIEILKLSIIASTPEELRTLSQKIIEEEIKLQSLQTMLAQLNIIVRNYDQKFNQLPKTTIELARLQRNRESLEKLFVLVEEKYQEALINEQSQPGNVYIIDIARIPASPSKPNRMLIILVGFVMGIGLAFGFAFIRNYFDNTIKTPEDIQNRNINVLSWIPQIESMSATGTTDFEFIVHQKPDSIPSEAFRALRTRVQYSRIDTTSLKVILVTSSAPSEGKTMICANLAGSFAQSNKKTLIIDCDLRKPRVHSFFKANRYPGLIDYFFNQVSFDEILRKSDQENLYYITAGTIPPNPAETLESPRMREFIDGLRDKFDYILLDSPPVIAVTDSEILSRLADGTILVVSANTTEKELMEKAVEIIRQDNVSFLGAVLNNFIYKSSYGSYYKYYYYYSRPKKGDSNPSAKPPVINN